MLNKKFKKIMQKKNYNKGFTLIETLVAILILMSTVTAIMYLVVNIIISTRSAKFENTAQYLLQEGIEYVRNNRDSALNGGATWNDFKQTGPSCPSTIGSGTVSLCECVYYSGTTGSCTVDPIFEEVKACPSNGCPQMISIENLGRTIYCTPGTNCPGFGSVVSGSTFVRSVRITPNNLNPDEVFVDVNVKWIDTGGKLKEKNLTTSLFNW